MNEYRVYLHEEKGDKFQLIFDCFADDEDHAIDLAVEEASENPDGTWEARIDPYDSDNFNGTNK